MQNYFVIKGEVRELGLLDMITRASVMNGPLKDVNFISSLSPGQLRLFKLEYKAASIKETVSNVWSKREHHQRDILQDRKCICARYQGSKIPCRHILTHEFILCHAMDTYVFVRNEDDRQKYGKQFEAGIFLGYDNTTKIIRYLKGTLLNGKIARTGNFRADKVIYFPHYQRNKD
ncbi:unnamed protein product [Ambrosiozyma monospora]|uniref:Unnamed protein product n=1 Tax=Ambrosiozyma monospora TaxID=43982 RepID=A0A9W6YZD3_AMBMO|nr:unnamed protein product [Ambrosiozyma monospora]